MISNDNNQMAKLRTGVLEWYEFKDGADVLCISDDGLFAECLARKGVNACSLTIRESVHDEEEGVYDYIVAIGALELCYEPVKMLSVWKRKLKGGGHLILGIHNRLGVKYFCGEKDPYTGKLFDGISGYRNIRDNSPRITGGRLYSRNETEYMLSEAGFGNIRLFSVLPDLETAQYIIRDGCAPNEDLSVRLAPQYSHADSVYLDELHLYDEMVKNGMLHQTANAYLIDCSEDLLLDVSSVTLTSGRMADKRFATVIHDNGTVVKKALEPDGVSNLRKLKSNMDELRGMGVRTVDVTLDGNRLTMPYLKGELAVLHLRKLLKTDTDRFVAEMDRFRDIILGSSRHVNDADGNVVLEHGFVDLVPINCFYIDGEYVFIDQEFMVENYPANAIIFRMVAFVYDGDRTRDAILSESFFYKRYGVDREMDRWYRMSVEFTDWIGVDTIRNQTIPNAIRTNQDIMNNGFADEYLLLNTCFSNTEGMGIYIFGTGKYAEKFWAFYHTHYEIAGVVDNNPDKWGSDFHGVGIMDPKLLESADRENTKIIMCMASYGDVYLQLRGMGFRNIGLYKAGHIYRGRQALFDDGRRHGTEEPGKKYRVGYVAGVFDLFHIGHLNLLRRAKEMCDYLVVGVVSDEQVRRNKHKEPFIPFEERIEIVRSCRYVDEANEIPIDYSGTVEAFQAYHFDAQFSGSDYVNDVWWLRQKEYLEAHGAELIFFPYTESTSSTMIQAAVRDATGRKS